MSQPNLESASVPSSFSKKPQLNIYFVMLVVSLISLLLGCLFLYLELQQFEKDKRSAALSPARSAASSPLSMDTLI